jgi:hypothetical protein
LRIDWVGIIEQIFIFYYLIGMISTPISCKEKNTV